MIDESLIDAIAFYPRQFTVTLYDAKSGKTIDTDYHGETARQCLANVRAAIKKSHAHRWCSITGIRDPHGTLSVRLVH